MNKVNYQPGAKTKSSTLYLCILVGMSGIPNTYNVRCRAVILHDEKLLVVKNVGVLDYYALPGGHIDHGEGPKECMSRELVEELGIAPQIGRLIFVHTFKDSRNNHCVEFIFEIRNSSEYVAHEEKEKSHAYEIEEVLWVRKNDDIKIFPEKVIKHIFDGVQTKDVIFISS